MYVLFNGKTSQLNSLLLSLWKVMKVGNLVLWRCESVYIYDVSHQCLFFFDMFILIYELLYIE